MYTVHEVLMASVLGRSSIPSSGGSRFMGALHCGLSVLGGLTRHDPQCHWVMPTPLPRWGRDITLLTKVCIVKVMVFPVVTDGCKNWTLEKAEHQIFDAFELWCWRRLLRVPWTAGRSNESILREINPEYSLEGLMPRLRLQHFRHLMWTTDSLSKSLMLGRLRQKEQRVRGWDGRMASPMQRTWTWATLRRWWGTGRPGVLQSTGSQEIGHDWVTEQQHREFLDGKINLCIYLWWWRKWMLLSWVWISVTP